jgi:small subunit ribosomal protein S13
LPEATDSESPEYEEGEFKYIVRLANTDLDGHSTVEYALTGIKGIGIRVGASLADCAGIPRTKKIGELTDAEVDKLEEIIRDLQNNLPPWLLNRRRDLETGEDRHIFSTDIPLVLRDDINRLKKIRCYRGIRHEQGQKVRGQRTRSNGRTGLTLGVIKKKARGEARAKAKPKAKEKKK